ncbi:hypothetical protein V6N13_030583 [Hibiscus sabdariffa]
MAPKGTCRGRSTRIGQVARAALKRNFHLAAGRILCRRLKYATGYFKKLVVGPRGGSAGLPHGEHRSARPYCRRSAPGLNWPGRSSGAVTLKKLECSKQAYACIH